MEQEKSQAQSFGKTKSGEQAHLYTLTNKTGIMVKITDFGATIVEVLTPDKKGILADITLGFDSVEGYESDRNQHFGCTVGRVCNRTANSKFQVGDTTYKLESNVPGGHHLHGGVKNPLQFKMWEVKEQTCSKLIFGVISPHLQEGYPGNLEVTALYELNEKNELKILYKATADAITPVNITNHAYWNLEGEGSSSADLLAHELEIKAHFYNPTDQASIPTGAISELPVSMQFSKSKAVGKDIGELTGTPYKGYDHNYVLDKHCGEMEQVAVVRAPKSGRVMKVSTTAPGMQLYTGNFLHEQQGKKGHKYQQHSALCLETQRFPNSANIKHFPRIFIKPEEQFCSETVLKFDAEH